MTALLTQLTPYRRWIVGLCLLWAALYLPNLRTNPNWYGDEGEWMQMSWTVAHGKPQVGPLQNDFVYPTPYPPLYMVLNGALLRVFGYDILVSRFLGALVALATVGVLVWVGARLRGVEFGLLCGAAFLVYSEAVINFRWVRSHPMAGLLSLVSVGFLVGYVQNKRWSDVAWAAVFCSLALATNYYTYPLVGAVVVTSFCVNRRHVVGAGLIACSYVLLFVTAYSLLGGGWDRLLLQAGRAAQMASGDGGESLLGQVVRLYRNLVSFCLLTPARAGNVGVDLWLCLAALGTVFFPVPRFRKWLGLWLVALMYAVFKKLDNVSMFFYPATIFLPVLAIGFAGALDSAVTWAAACRPNISAAMVRRVVCGITLGLFGAGALLGAWDHYHTKIDMWSQQSVPQAERVAAFINEQVTAQDLVIAPKQIYWKLPRPRLAMLWQTVPFHGGTNAAYPVPIPPDLFAYDPSWEQARFVVLASGLDGNGQSPRGIDLIYTQGLQGMREIVDRIVREKWPVVFSDGRRVVNISLGGGLSWPVALNGEYLVLANPKYLSP